MMNFSSIMFPANVTPGVPVTQGTIPTGNTQVPLAFSLVMQAQASKSVGDLMTLETGASEGAPTDGGLDLTSALSAFLQGEANPSEQSSLTAQPVPVSLPQGSIQSAANPEGASLAVQTSIPVTPGALTPATQALGPQQPGIVSGNQASAVPIAQPSSQPNLIAQPTVQSSVQTSTTPAISAGQPPQTMAGAPVVNVGPSPVQPQVAVSQSTLTQTPQANPAVPEQTSIPANVNGPSPSEALQSVSKSGVPEPIAQIKPTSTTAPAAQANQATPPEAAAQIKATLLQETAAPVKQVVPQEAVAQPKLAPLPTPVVAAAKSLPTVVTDITKQPQVVVPALVAAAAVAPKVVETRSTNSIAAPSVSKVRGTTVTTSAAVATQAVSQSIGSTSIAPAPSIAVEAAVQDPAPLADPLQKPTFLTQTEKPAGAIFAPVAAPKELAQGMEPLRAEPLSIQLPENTISARMAAAQEITQKPPAKPFTEALMAQVKSVEVSEGRTTVSLHPRGLGNIEIEVIAEKDLASKVVVRVENPAVLQALRDDRQSLAQAINVSDSSILEFRDHDSGDQSNGHQSQGGKGGGGSTETGGTSAEKTHQDVVENGQLDILT